MMDAVTPLGPAACAAREQNDAEARVDRWDAAVRLLAEDSNESLVRKHLAAQDGNVLQACMRLYTLLHLGHFCVAEFCH